MLDFNDSIAAIATPPGRGGIAIVRISGPDARKVATLITKAHDPKLNALKELPAELPPELSAAPLKPRYVYLRKFYDGLDEVDEGVIVYYAAPHSYTGEDVVELQGHGGNVVPQRVLSAVLKIAGVRQAEPGEFTRRAFLNGKMDLTAADAVEDLISAGSESAAKPALEACLDFPEEHEDFFDSGRAQSELAHLCALTQEAVTIAGQGVRLNEGARIVLAGQPNAGKSSLLNALAGSERAIVTNIPGTTRDVLTINIEIGGIPVTITDTAGIRDRPSDEIEAIGIARALDELKQADLILLMIDTSKPAAEALEALNHMQKLFDHPKHLMVLKSKSDLPPNAETAALLTQEPWAQMEQIATSTKTEHGLEQLRRKLHEVLGIIPSEGVFSARRRHLTALNESAEALKRAQEMLELGDLVLTARELSIAQEHLGTITGKVTSDDILGIIFSTFCIGK